LLRQSLRVSIAERKSQEMNQLIKSLPQVLRASGNSPEVAEAAAIAAWKFVAGDGLKEHAVPDQEHPTPGVENGHKTEQNTN
jgi:hypothetical protein